MELAKCIFITFEILLSTWIIYRSGRIVLNKGDTDDSSKLINNHLMLMVVGTTGYLSILWRLAFSSWVLLCCSLIYVLVYIIYVINEPRRKK